MKAAQVASAAMTPQMTVTLSLILFNGSTSHVAIANVPVTAAPSEYTCSAASRQAVFR